METKIIKTQKIESTTFSMEANILTLDTTPSLKEQDKFFGNNKTIVLEF